MAGDGHFPEMKTFYQKVDPVAPYATTALIQQQNMMKQRVGELSEKNGHCHLLPVFTNFILDSEVAETVPLKNYKQAGGSS